MYDLSSPDGPNVITFKCTGNYIYPKYYISQIPSYLPDFESRDLHNACWFMYMYQLQTQQWAISANQNLWHIFHQSQM